MHEKQHHEGSELANIDDIEIMPLADDDLVHVVGGRCSRIHCSNTYTRLPDAMEGAAEDITS